MTSFLCWPCFCSLESKTEIFSFQRRVVWYFKTVLQAVLVYSICEVSRYLLAYSMLEGHAVLFYACLLGDP